MTIKTPRLVLREFRKEDLTALYTLVSDPAVMKFSGGVENKTEAGHRLERYRKEYAQHGFGKWAVTQKSSGEVVGYCGFGLEEFDGRLELELGFRFVPNCWGLGFASEAARASSLYGFSTLGFQRFLGFAHPENLASRRVLEKLGMQLLGDRIFHGQPVVLYLSPNPGTNQTPGQTTGGRS